MNADADAPAATGLAVVGAQFVALVFALVLVGRGPEVSAVSLGGSRVSVAVLAGACCLFAFGLGAARTGRSQGTRKGLAELAVGAGVTLPLFVGASLPVLVVSVGVLVVGLLGRMSGFADIL